MTFKFPHQFWVVLSIGTLVCSIVLLNIYLLKSPISWGNAAGMVLSLFLLWVVIVALCGRSNIVVSNSSISRTLLGCTWQTIQWDNIRLIRAFPISDGYGHKKYGFNIFPVTRTDFGSIVLGKMSFSNGMERAPEFVTLLNSYVEKHHIKVEVRDDQLGEFHPGDRL